MFLLSLLIAGGCCCCLFIQIPKSSVSYTVAISAIQSYDWEVETGQHHFFPCIWFPSNPGRAALCTSLVHEKWAPRYRCQLGVELTSDFFCDNHEQLSNSSNPISQNNNSFGWNCPGMSWRIKQFIHVNPLLRTTLYGKSGILQGQTIL